LRGDLDEVRNGALATSSVTLGAARDETRLRFVFRDLTATSGTDPMPPRWAMAVRGARSGCAGRGRRYRRRACLCRRAFAGYLGGRCRPYGTTSEGDAVLLEDGRASIELVTAIYDAARAVGP
jgi:hypothetical protein